MPTFFTTKHLETQALENINRCFSLSQRDCSSEQFYDDLPMLLESLNNLVTCKHSWVYQPERNQLIAKSINWFVQYQENAGLDLLTKLNVNFRKVCHDKYSFYSSLFHTAAAYPNHQTIALLYDNHMKYVGEKTRPNEKHLFQKACSIACQHGQLETMRFIFNKCGASALPTTTINGLPLLNYLIYAANQDEETEESMCEVIKFLIEQDGIDLNKPQKSIISYAIRSPLTPLMMAVHSQTLKITNLLLDNDVDLQAKNERGQTAFQMAEELHKKALEKATNPVDMNASKLTQMINLLLSYGADSSNSSLNCMSV